MRKLTNVEKLLGIFILVIVFVFVVVLTLDMNSESKDIGVIELEHFSKCYEDNVGFGITEIKRVTGPNLAKVLTKWAEENPTREPVEVIFLQPYRTIIIIYKLVTCSKGQ